MRIHTGFEITYDCPMPVPMLLMLSVHPSRRGDLETPDWLRTDPVVDVRQYLDAYGNICSRVLAPAGRFVTSSDFIIRDSGLADDRGPDAIQVAVHNLPDDALVYLLGSRYCETDVLSRTTAWSLFGRTELGWPHACKPSATSCTTTSGSTTSRPARPVAPTRPMKRPSASAATTRTWPSLFAAA